MPDITTPSEPADVLQHVGPGADLIVPLANGEPVSLLDAVEANAEQLEGVRVHQMHAVHDRRYLHGAFGTRLRHVSYFLSHVTRPCFRAGTIDLVPNNFSEMRAILADRTDDPLVLAAAAPPDRHGYFSLGVSADYVSSFIGRARFFLEANAQMPRTFGRNQIHISQVVGWVEVDRPLVEVAPPPRTAIDERIAAFVAERIPSGATIQTGIGSIPNAILSALSGHRDLGVHTELLSDGLMDLVDAGVVTGVAKQLNRTKAVGTFALGTRAPVRLPRRERGIRAVARALCQRPSCHRPGGRVRVDQLDDRRRPARPVRERDRRRRLLLVERRSGRLRPRRDVLQGRARFRRARVHRQARHDLQDRGSSSPPETS